MPPFNRDSAEAKLRHIDQLHLLAEWGELTEGERHALISEVEAINVAVLEKQRALLKRKGKAKGGLGNPLAEVALEGNCERGIQCLREGKIGCLLIAGGQGTRLGFSGPKGDFPVSVVAKKSLFQLFAERTIAAGEAVGRLLPLAVMTSPLNHDETLHFFAEHDNFGLQESQLSFFPQEMLPFLDDERNLFLSRPGEIAEGPNGNGLALHQFYESGLWKQWREQGIEFLQYVLVDNALADPFDVDLIGFHAREGAEVAIQCIERSSPTEKVGVLVEGGRVVEYSELPESELEAVTDDGALKYPWANISRFSFTMDFIEKVAVVELPLHLAHKKAKRLHGEKMAWKFETFIFDVLQEAKKISVLAASRSRCFAPLKSRAGENGLERVQEALQECDRKQFEKIIGGETPKEVFELDPRFYYNFSEAVPHWRGTLKDDGLVIELMR